MSKSQLRWMLFAWAGIPALFTVCVFLTALPVRPGGVIVLTTVAFVAGGTWALAAGQRPRRSWIVLLYPIPMYMLLSFIMVGLVLMGPRGV